MPRARRAGPRHRLKRSGAARTYVDVGDRDRFDALFQSNYHLILGYASRRVEGADAHDVVAETFTIAWRRIDAIPAGDEARLWLYATARRVVANHRRAERRRLRLVARLHADPTAAAPAEPQLGGDIARAFAALGPEDRDLLGLVAWEGLGTDELARVLGCSPPAVRLRLHRARRRFAQAFRERQPPLATRIREDSA